MLFLRQPSSAQTTLPPPTEEGAAHSRKAAGYIMADIAAQGGWISFARYQELALFAPGLGYYSAGATKFGQSGDFITAPEISVLFGRTLARQAAEVLRLTGGDVLEIGAGSGRLAVDLLTELEQLGVLPERYLILEVSADLRERQQALVRQIAPHLAARVGWLDTLPTGFVGVMIGNEVLDCMPVHLIAWRDGQIFERGVSVEQTEPGGQERFAWAERPLPAGELYDAARALGPLDNYLSEIGLAARGFIRSLAAALTRGALLLIDYGYSAPEYYHPQRNQGTLMCHYRHYAHPDPFYLPGLQDITCHVDFSAITASAHTAGLDLLGYTTQARFMINCGLLNLLERNDPTDTATYLPLANQVNRLLSPAEMGELFKVIALGKGVDTPLSGFSSPRQVL